MSHETWVVAAAVLAVSVLLVMIITFKVQEFLALLLTTLAFGLAVGTSPNDLMDLVVAEMGDSLGQLALVIALGAIFGTVLSRAGAAQRIAITLTEGFSDRVVLWGLGLAGFLVGTSVYIDVAIVVLVPMLYTVAQKTGRSLLHYGIPLCAGLSTAYTFMPPAPGPLAASEIMGADLGLVILFGVLCGIPAVAVAGPFFGRYIARRIMVEPPLQTMAAVAPSGAAADRTPARVSAGEGGTVEPAETVPAGGGVDLIGDVDDLPSFRTVVGALLMPMGLIVLGTIARQVGGDSVVVQTLTFIGGPVMALLITCLYSLWAFGLRRGASTEELRGLASDALGPAGMIILITGAGSVFGGVLISSGLGDTLSEAMKGASVPLVVFGFIVAAVMRISQGSGLVAMITGATFSAPLAESMGANDATVALTCIAIACGGAGFSHVNDSGFWMANRYFGMSVADTLRSWTVMKSLVGLTGFVVVLVVSPFVA